MREIKFRVFDEGRFWYFHIGQVWDDETKRKYFQFCLDGKKFEQFMGLKDKNGVEIFERDIVRSVSIDEYADTRTERVVVEEIKDLIIYINTLTWIPKHGEVIGNIHENKELLK